MSIIFSALRKADLTADLSDGEIALLATLFELHSYTAGAFISRPVVSETDSLYLLLEGHLEITVQSIEGQLDIHLIKPGDLANIIAFVGGANHTSTQLCALESSRVMSLSRRCFEGLACTHPTLVYGVQRGIARYVHNVMRSMNFELNSLSHQVSGIASATFLEGSLA